MTSPEERRDRVAELTRQGLSARMIANMLKISARTVCRARVARGCAQQPPIALSDTELGIAKSLLDDGASYNEVARTIGHSHKTLSRRLPGYTWDRAQIAESAALGRLMARLERTISA